MGRALLRFFRKYADFTGRASRSEYWWMVLWEVLITIVLVAASIEGALVLLDVDGLRWLVSVEPSESVVPLDLVIAGPLLLWRGVTFIPSCALGVRRLHDANYSGTLLLLVIVPFGALVIAVLALARQDPRGVRFDDRPVAGRWRYRT